MKKWTMDVNILAKGIAVKSESKEEAIKKAKQMLKETLCMAGISFDENNIKIDKKSIVMSEE